MGLGSSPERAVFPPSTLCHPEPHLHPWQADVEGEARHQRLGAQLVEQGVARRSVGDHQWGLFSGRVPLERRLEIALVGHHQRRHVAHEATLRILVDREARQSRLLTVELELELAARSLGRQLEPGLVSVERAAQLPREVLEVTCRNDERHRVQRDRGEA